MMGVSQATVRILGHALLAVWMMVTFVVLLGLDSSARFLTNWELMVAVVAYVAGNSAHAIALTASPTGVTVSTVQGVRTSNDPANG